MTKAQRGAAEIEVKDKGAGRDSQRGAKEREEREGEERKAQGGADEIKDNERQKTYEKLVMTVGEVVTTQV